MKQAHLLRINSAKDIRSFMFLRLKGMLLRSRSLASGAMRLWGTHCTSSKGIYFTMWIHRGAGGKNCKNLQSKIWDFKGFLGLCLLSHGYVPEPLRSVLFFLSSFQKEREREMNITGRKNSPKCWRFWGVKDSRSRQKETLERGMGECPNLGWYQMFHTAWGRQGSELDFVISSCFKKGFKQESEVTEFTF